jgi:hypothetical protein
VFQIYFLSLFHQTKRMSFFHKWSYLRIELEINGIVTDTRFIQSKEYEKTFEFFKSLGENQRYEWAIFVKRHIGKKSQYQRERRRRIDRENYKINKTTNT